MGLQVRPFTLSVGFPVHRFRRGGFVHQPHDSTGKEYRAEHQAALAAKQDLQRLSSRLWSRRSRSGRPFSRELHDQVGQALTAIKIDIARAEQGLDPTQNDLIERLRRARQRRRANTGNHPALSMRCGLHARRPGSQRGSGLVRPNSSRRALRFA